MKFELINFSAQRSANPFQVLRNEKILAEDKFETIDERKEAREIMSLVLQDDIKSMKEGKLYLKIFAEARNGFVSQFDLFRKREPKSIIKNPKNPNIVEFEITDVCITNLPGIWFNKHFYW